MRARICWFLSMLLAGMPLQAATKSQSKNMLAGNMQDLVSWSPLTMLRNYQAETPPPDKIAYFEKLGYSAVTLMERHEINLKQNNFVEEIVTNSVLYLNSSGIEKSGNSGFWIDTINQRVDILAAYVLQADGTKVNVDPTTLQMSNDNSTSIFNDYSFVTVPFPQLKPKSIAILTYKMISSNDNLHLPWSRLLYPAGFGHIENFQAQVNWETDKQKPGWKTDWPKLECKESPFSLYCATTEASLPLPIERDMPPFYDVLPVLVFSEATNWGQISGNMQFLSEQALSKTEKIKEFAEGLINNAVEPEQKLSLLATFVAREIRYVGIEHGRHNIEPKPTLITLEQRFGDCKDKTMLFVDLARQVGLDAYPVLTSSKRFSLDKLLLPAASYFNHMIACVKLSPYKETCLDLTDSEISPEYLPVSLQGAIRLTVGKNTNKPENLSSELYAWIANNKADIQLTNDGAILESLERTYDSHWAAGLRRNLAPKSKEERDRWLIEDYRSAMSDKASPSLKLQGIDQSQGVVKISTSTEFRNVFNPFQLTSYNDFDPWLINLTKNLKSTNTHYSYVFQGIDYHSQITYQLYSGKVVNNLGPKLEYISTWGSLNRHYRKDDATITAFTELKMPRKIIPLEKIADFNRFIDLSSRETRIWFSLR